MAYPWPHGQALAQSPSGTVSPGKLRPQTELMQPIPASHQTREAALGRTLAPRDPCQPGCTTFCQHSLGVEEEGRSEANKQWATPQLF